MEKCLKRVVLKEFPQLQDEPIQLGRIISTKKTNNEESTNAKPVYCVDIQPLTAKLIDAKKQPLIDVAVVLPYVGGGSGFFSLPKKDAIVIYKLSSLLPDLVMVMGCLPYGSQIPKLENNEAIWQQSSHCSLKYTQSSDWEQFGRINQSISSMKHIINSKKIWLGNDSTNILQVISDFMETTAQALKTLSLHSHSKHGQPPSQSGEIASKSDSASSDSENLKIFLD